MAGRRGSVWSWARRRELGGGCGGGGGDALARSLYCSMKPVAEWDPFRLSGSQLYGGVFNLEFSPEGTLLVAACEKKAILIFDPLTHEKIHTVSEAHMDCVNCVKFLDGRMFATCSDDTTIALWDVRNLKKKICTLSGHSNWVKNIEYSVKDNLLVTSGLDGSIYTWDINSYTEWSLVYQRVFHTSGLMRCRISPDASQMVMCTTGGLLIIIHNLNLSTLARDLQGFKPNLYRLMQMNEEVIPLALVHDHLFDRKRHENRVEFVTDFPEGNDAKVVSSLQIHPQGWSALSRNISHDDRSEWTCVHDIQADIGSEDKSVRDNEEGEEPLEPPGPPRPPPKKPPPGPMRRLRCTLRRAGRQQGDEQLIYARAQGRTRPVDGTPPPTPPPPPAEPQAGSSGSGSDSVAGPSTDQPGPSRDQPGPSRDQPGPSNEGPRIFVGIQNDVWEASITIKQHRTLQDMARRGQVGRNFNMQRIVGINTGITPLTEARRERIRQNSSSNLPPNTIHDRIRPSTSGATVRIRYLDPDPDDPVPDPDSLYRPIRQNKDRLLYYVQETNEGEGFIKELCYSADGRLICSPFGFGIRLLALDDQCSELNECVIEGSPAKRLTEVGQCVGQHLDLVVSTKFSPRHHLLVSGCLAGKIVWYQPQG